MKVEVLKNERVRDFIEYCKNHKNEVDDSFLYDEDLDEFEPNTENPTYILINQQGEIKGSASLIIDEYNKRGKRARFRIFHTELTDINDYRQLLEAILQDATGLESVYLFIPMKNKQLVDTIEKLDFSIERYSYVLVRENMDVPEWKLPEDYYIKTFRPGVDETVWSEVRNAGFAKVKGNETPVTPEMVAKLVSSTDYIDGGMQILYHLAKVVGVVMGAIDEYEDAPIMNIGPVAVIPEYQGIGLGRLLLRAALHFAKENAFKRTILSVNPENDKAINLYLQEGFQEVESFVSFEFKIAGANLQQ
ncbi:MAG: family N-acetyltransferase [Neobacillus sp.]|jgi:mycothiol synthase|nr:family N-acetyltransferase [Neobacillus sp.]